MSDARIPSSTRTASTCTSPRARIRADTAWLDMSSVDHPVSRSVYLVVLRKDILRRSPRRATRRRTRTQTKADDKTKIRTRKTMPRTRQAEEPPKFKIDLDNIGQRILALPIPAAITSDMAAGKTGILFLLEAPVADPGADRPPLTVHKFDLKTRKTRSSSTASADFRDLAQRREDAVPAGRQWFIAGNRLAPPKPAQGALKLDAMEVRVDPREEWKQMYHEVWRIERDFFYDPGLHGLEPEGRREEVRAYLDSIASRDDLNYLFEEMLGEMTVGHMFVGGGDRPRSRRQVPGGLLGADYKVENGRYRFARVYNGENWNPQSTRRSPSRRQRQGRRIPAGGQRPRRARRPRMSTASFEAPPASRGDSRSARIRTARGSREVTVVPVAERAGLRNLAWIEDNRRKVDQLSGGRLAYVYLPDTAGGGFTNFNRYYLRPGRQRRRPSSTSGSTAAAQLADYIIEYLRRPLMSLFTTRDGETSRTPQSHLRAEGDDHQRIRGLGRRRHAVVFPAARRRPAGRQADLGRTGGHLGFPPLMDGGQCHGAEPGLLEPERRVGGGEPRRRTGHRGRIRSGGGARGPRSATGEGGRSGDGGAEEAPAAGL